MSGSTIVRLKPRRVTSAFTRLIEGRHAWAVAILDVMPSDWLRPLAHPILRVKARCGRPARGYGRRCGQRSPESSVRG